MKCTGTSLRGHHTWVKERAFLTVVFQLQNFRKKGIRLYVTVYYCIRIWSLTVESYFPAIQNQKLKRKLIKIIGYFSKLVILF